MNIRWPLWLPTPTKEGGFFAVQVIALIFLLLGHFSNLPLIPSFDKIPTGSKQVGIWLLAMSAINYSIIIRYAKNDYLTIKDAFLPSLLTWVLLTVLFFVSVYIGEPSTDFSILGIQYFRVFLYSQIIMFVVLNISFLFKDNNSPVRDVAKELQYIRLIWRRRAEWRSSSEEERERLIKDIDSILQALRAALIKNTASFNRPKDNVEEVRVSDCVEKAIDLFKTRGPEMSFRELENDDNDLSRNVKCIVEYYP